MGPTASGKSQTALQAAARLDAEIISIDSMQVYRGMDIGTAKPTAAERAQVPHHMLDLVDPEEDFSAAEFQSIAREVIDRSERNLILAGGSGLHLRAVIDPLTFEPSDPAIRKSLEAQSDEDLCAALLDADPAAADHVDLSNRRRVVRALEVLELTGRNPSVRARRPERREIDSYTALYEVSIVGVDPADSLAERAERRIDSMFRAGFEEEVARLRGRMGRTASQAVGYREVIEGLEGRLPTPAVRAGILSATLALAKRQRTWFRRDPRIRWVEWNDDADRRLDAVMREWLA